MDNLSVAIVGGTGNLGSALALRLGAPGVKIIIGSRDADKAKKAVETLRPQLRAGEMLDGEGGYTVWGKLMPASKGLSVGALPIGLAHRVKLKNDVAHGAVVRWNDVEVDANSDTIQTRKAMETAFASAR